MKHAAKKQWLVAAVFTILAGTVGGVNAGAVSLPPADHVLVKGDQLDQVDTTADGYLYGVVGGNAYLDGSSKTALSNIAGKQTLLSVVNGMISGSKDLIEGINKTFEVAADPAEGTAGIALSAKNGYTRYYGAIGGDLVINANTGIKWESSLLQSLLPESNDAKTAEIEVKRQGGIKNNIQSGSVIIGTGASTAVGIGNITGNISADKKTSILDIHVSADAQTGGTSIATLTGNVDTQIQKDANVIGFANGGLAAGIGGGAISTVNGNTVLIIQGGDKDAALNTIEDSSKDTFPQLTTALNVMKGSGINAIGVTGGGAAVTTLGGTAKSEVTGTTAINVKDGTIIAAFGGGAAASVDATGAVKALLFPDRQIGNDDGTSDYEYKGGTVTAAVKVTNVNQGGTAISTTGETYINLTGKSSALGVFGGGAVAATHTYTWKDDKTNTSITGYKINDEYGKSEADATTGKAHISVNLTTPEDGGLTDTEKGNLVGAFTGFASGLANDSTKEDALKDFSGKGAVVGVFGGGLAVAQSGNQKLLSDQELSSKDGAFATASTEGADINLASGYAVGVFGGGLAGTINNATATASMTDDVKIDIGEKMETVGVFGNGLAYFTGSSNGGQNHLKGQASVTAENTSITVTGKADGVFGGGLAIDDSQADITNASAVTNGTSTILVQDGAEVGKVNFGVVGTNAPSGAPDLSSYADGAKAAVGKVAIAGGGVALGGGASTSVKESVITVAGGMVDGNIIGGGAAAYGYAGENKGSTVETSTINLNGGTVDGDVYAGGAIATKTSSGSAVYGDYDKAQATVGNATINLAGTEVKGILSGGGLKNGEASDEESVKAKKSELNLIGGNTLIAVDGKSKISGFTNVNAKAGSVTKLEGLAAGDTTPFIDGKGGTVTVESGASLDISKLDQSDDKYLIAGNYANSSTFWGNDDLLYDRFTAYAEAENADGKYTISYSEITKDNAGKAADEFADRLDAPWTKPLIEKGMTDGFGDYTGSQTYFSDWNTNRDTASEAYNRGGLIGEDTAVTGNTVSIASDMADHVVQRLSFTEEYIVAPGWVNEDGGIWAKYVHKKYEAKGLGSTVGGVHASSDYDGAIVGMDFAKKGKFQYGAAFHYGTGEGNGVISSNDYDAWGLALYGSLKDEAAHTNLMADIGYTKTSNDITGYVNGKSLTADRDVDVWTLGVRGEKEYISGRNQIVPYAGLRYIHTAPSRYTSYYDGQKAFDYDAENQDIWLLPVGVSLRNETVTASGWKVTPKVDLSYIWAFGDTDGTTDVWMNGGVSSLAYTVMDDSWLAAVGVEATKDVWSYGLGYSYQKGDDTKSTKWYVSASYAF